MKINYELTQEDYIGFNFNFIETSPVMKRSLFVQRFLFPIIYLILPKFLSPIMDIPYWFLMIFFAATALLWMGFYVKWYKRRIAKNIKKMLNKGRVPGIVGKHELVIDKVQISDKTLESFTNYNTVEKLNETKTFFYVYVNEVMAYMVPKAAFENEAELQQFRDLVAQLTIKKD
ncbi:YcxB family protein [Fusibacter bizertensis]